MENKQPYDYIVLGGGVTGMTLCRKLKEKGYSVIVLEKNDEPGGLCRTRTISGHTLDIGGGHFFNTKLPDVKEYVFDLVGKERFNFFNPRISKIKINNSIIDYPLESNIWQLPLEESIKFLISIIRNGESVGNKQPSSYYDWIRWKLGDSVCDEYMVPYNKKLWGVNPEEMDIDWLYKIPRVDVHEIVRYFIERKQDTNKYPAHQSFYYPKVGGFQIIVDAMYSQIHNDVLLNEKVESLCFDGKYWTVNGKWIGIHVVNTIPWCDLFRPLGKPSSLIDSFAKIRYNQIEVALYEKEVNVDWHWCYVPDEKVRHHREFYIPNFAKDSKHNGVYIETNVNRTDSDTLQFDGKLIYSVITDAAYPIPIIGHSQAISTILKHYEPLGLFGIGRWGQHQYQNADVSIGEALKFVKQLKHKK